MRSDLGKYLTSLVLFGMQGVVAGMVILSSCELVLVRAMFGALCLSGILVATRREFTLFQNKRSLALLVGAGVCMGLEWLFLYESFALIGVGTGTLLYYTGSVIVMALSPVLFKEKLPPLKILGFMVVIAGVVCLQVNALGTGVSAWGIATGFLGAVFCAGMLIFNRYSEAEGLQVPCTQLTVALVTLAVVMLAMGRIPFAVPTHDWPWVIFLGAVITGLACYMYFSTISKLPMQTVAVCAAVEPLSAVVLAAIFLGEAVLPLQAIGGVLIVGGATFCELVGRQHHSYGKYGYFTHEHSRMHRAKRAIVDWAFTPTHY